MEKIDTEARKAYAKMLRLFGAGLITNRDFDDCKLGIRESAILEIDTFGILPFYDEREEYTLSAGRKLGAENRHLFARVILFLHSDLPYRWPRVMGLRNFWNAILALVPTLHPMYLKRAVGGDPAVWPFYTRAEYERALLDPPFLCGRRSAK